MFPLFLPSRGHVLRTTFIQITPAVNIFWKYIELLFGHAEFLIPVTTAIAILTSPNVASMGPHRYPWSVRCTLSSQRFVQSISALIAVTGTCLTNPHPPPPPPTHTHTPHPHPHTPTPADTYWKWYQNTSNNTFINEYKRRYGICIYGVSDPEIVWLQSTCFPDMKLSLNLGYIE